MRQLERAWDAHNAALLQRDVTAALTHLAARSSIQHILCDHAMLTAQLGIRPLQSSPR